LAQGQLKGVAMSAKDKEMVWCVEDEPDIGLLLSRILENLSIDVVHIHDPQIALDKMETQRPDLIVLDLMLPSMTGWDFLERIRKNEKWKDIPVIILSVRTGSGDRLRANELGVAHYMTKPFVPTELQRVVREILDLDEREI
jgi:DNA-binding response OmpR family regulator